MSFLLAGPSITELAREKVVIDLFRMKTFSQCWEIWQPEISRYLNRPQFARHFSVIQNDYERGEYEQEAISRRV